MQNQQHPDVIWICLSTGEAPRLWCAPAQSWCCVQKCCSEWPGWQGPPCPEMSQTPWPGQPVLLARRGASPVPPSSVWGNERETNKAFLLLLLGWWHCTCMYPFPLVTFLLCTNVCVCVCVCMRVCVCACVLACVCVCARKCTWGIQYHDYIIYYFWDLNECIIIDLVKWGVLTFVSEIWCYRNDRYYCIIVYM